MAKLRIRRHERQTHDRAEADAVTAWLAEVSQASDDIFGRGHWHGDTEDGGNDRHHDAH